MYQAYDVVVIGGGAAGFYGAIHACEKDADLKTLIVERSPKVLSKVRVSGGGRCNVTHACHDAVRLASHYPRGGKWLRNLFRQYGVQDVVTWFREQGVALKTEEDGRMFPVSDSSQTIIDCFMQHAERSGITVSTNSRVVNVGQIAGGWEITLQDGRIVRACAVLVATGGSADRSAYGWIEQLGHSIVKPIPSLFTFNDPAKTFGDLMGLSVPHAEVSIPSTRFRSSGPVLITHWGLSGPAVIRLSAWAAEHLNERKYEFTAVVNWTGTFTEEDVRKYLLNFKDENGRKGVCNNPLFALPARLWQRLCEMAGISARKIWAELPQKNMNRLMEFVIRCPVDVRGKTTFKEEFVTCGGVSLDDVDPATMESKICEGLFFAGEVLNIDGETGGFNFQAAWTTAYLAAEGMVRRNGRFTGPS